MSVRDLIVVGGGPAGLAAAIAAERRQLDYVVLEKGTVVNSIYHFPAHMVFFTTPELLEIGGLPFVSPFEKPTRIEALRYYRRVVDALQLRIEMDTTVCAVRRDEDTDTFVVDAQQMGRRVVMRARAVVMAIGYYDHPNILGVPGEDLPHVSHYYSDAHPFYRKQVVVVGGANSAAEAALELYRGGAKVTLVHRRPTFNRNIKYWVLPDLQNRIKEGSIAARLGARVVEIRPGEVVVERAGELPDKPGHDADPPADAARGLPLDAPSGWRPGVESEALAADAVFLLTGYHTDVDLLARAGVAIDDCTWMPAHDPETFETNVRNLFLAGGVVSGNNEVPVFIENGRFHGEKAVAVIAERLAQVHRER